MEFASPHWLWALAGLPVLYGLSLAAQSRSREALRKLGEAWLVARLTAGVDEGRRRWKRRLRLAALALILLAAARFQYGADRVPVQSRGIDLVIALDVSTSMLADDIAPNRLQKAKYEMGKLIGGLKGDRVALVAFAGSAYTVCPLTNDYAAANLFLSGIDTDSVGRQGTDLAEAVRIGMKAFGETPRGDRLMLILTDGEDHSGKAAEAAREAAAQGIRLHAVGVGDPQGRPIPTRTPDGRVVYKKDAQGNIVTTRLDIPTLTAMAQAGGGQFFHANAAAFSLETIFASIEAMQKAEFKTDLTLRRIDRYRWFLLPGLVLLGIEGGLHERRRRLPAWRGRFEP